MAEPVHKFLCPHCEVFIFGANTIRLASNLNEHNSTKHPFESSNWTGAGVVYSAHYVGPAQPNANWTDDRPDVVVDTRQPTPGPRPEYMRPHGTDENRFITEKGKRVLHDLGVKW